MLVLVVPCFNEEQRLEVGRFEEALARRDDVGLLFVDDGSSDGTARVLAEIGQATPDRVHVLSLDKNVGKAEAVRGGIFAARRRWPDARWLGFWDADLATPLSELTAFTQAMAEHPEARFFTGARVMLMGRQIERRALRHVLGRGFATFASLALKLRVYDTQCGAKIIDAALADELFSRAFISRWLFDVELLARLVDVYGEAQAETWIVEVPLRQWRDVGGSKLRPTDFARAALELAEIWRRS